MKFSVPRLTVTHPVRPIAGIKNGWYGGWYANVNWVNCNASGYARTKRVAYLKALVNVVLYRLRGNMVIWWR